MNSRMVLEDCSALAQLCFHHKLFRSLMFVSQQMGDFLTPILKIQSCLLAEHLPDTEATLLWYLHYLFNGLNIFRERLAD